MDGDGPMNYRIDVTCVYNGHVFYTLYQNSHKGYVYMRGHVYMRSLGIMDIQ